MPFTKSVVISCAGIGSRLGLGITKALINIEGRSLISYQLELFKDVEDLRIVVGYQAKKVIKEVLKYRKDVIFVYNHNYFDTKTGASFYLGAKDANEYVLEYDGDLVVHPQDMKMLLDYKGEFVGYSDISSTEAIFLKINEENKHVLSFSREKGDFEWTGPACLKRDKVKYSSEHVYNQIEPYLPMKGIKVRAYDIDTYEDYQNVSKIIKEWKNK